MKKSNTNKLVRDRVPNILIQQDLAFKASHLNLNKFRLQLSEKLIEESKELSTVIHNFEHVSEIEPISDKECDAYIEAIKDEMADVLEVFINIAKTYEISTQDLLITTENKRAGLGGFTDRIFLEWVEDKKGTKK